MAELRNIKPMFPGDNGCQPPTYRDTKDGCQPATYDNQAFEGFTGPDKGLPTSINDTRADNSLNEDEDLSGCSKCVQNIQNGISKFTKDNSRILWAIFGVLLLVGYFVYFGYCMWYEFGDEGSWRLLVCTILLTLGLLYKFISYRINKDKPDDDVGEEKECCPGLWKFADKMKFHIVLPVILFLAFVIYVIIDVGIDRPRNLISAGGMAFFVLTFYIFSHNPAKVKWRPVFWGIAIQAIFALLILRTSWGRDAFQWLGDRITEFLDHTDAGSKFVFGDAYMNHFFAFKVLPVVVFFSTIVSMLYYLGVMQIIIRNLGKFLSWALGTAPTESVNAAGNIFIGQTEAPLMIRPFLKDMTNSEIHAVMTGGFATIAGAVMAAYILYGVPANHLLSASVMSAPAALALAKLFYPETEKSKHTADDVYKLGKGDERNLIEAASNGASMSISLVANIAVNLIAFVALLDFVNATMVWFGDRAGYDGFTFQFICSYVFWPLAFLMGVDQDDCRKVAELIGTKTLLNEFIAYVDLSKIIGNQPIFDQYISNATVDLGLTGSWEWRSGDIYLMDTGVTLEHGIMSDRSIVIATYALCGFSNMASMGVQLGALGAMAPSRKGDMSKVVFRAMIAGNVACFMTACIAGLLYTGE